MADSNGQQSSVPMDSIKGANGATNELRRRKPPGFRNVATMVMQMSKDSKRNLMTSRSDTSDTVGNLRHSRHHHSNDEPKVSLQRSRATHRRVYSASQVPYHGEKATNTPKELVNTSFPFFAKSGGPTSSLLDHAQKLETLFQTPPRDDLPAFQQAYGVEIAYPRRDTISSSSIPEGGEGEEESDDEVSGYGSQDDISGGDNPNNQHTANSQPDVEHGHHPQDTTPLIQGRAKPKRALYRRLTRPFRAFMLVVKPDEIWTNIKQFLSTTVLLFMAPCLVAAAFFYYFLDDPGLEFLPSSNTLSWYFLLAVRLSVTFTLAQVSQWILQVVTIRMTVYVRIAGPLLALVAMQSMGWPFLVSSWGIWNLLLLHGKSDFARQWLYWTHIEMFSVDRNADAGILASESILASKIYGRLLATMILLGIAGALKQTFVALYFSRRMLQHYKGQLEQVMSQVKLVMEVAELAAQTEEAGFQVLLAKANRDKEDGDTAALPVVDRSKRNRLVEAVPLFAGEKKTKGPGSKKPSVKGLVGQDKDDDDDDDDDDDEEEEGGVSGTGITYDKARQPNEGCAEDSGFDAKMMWKWLKEQALNDRYTMNFVGEEVSVTDDRIPPANKSVKGHNRNSSTLSNKDTLNMIYPFLERWPEPEDKGRKNTVPNLHDILQFKKAMFFMETDYPFSPSFGSCITRKQAVKNSVKVYRRLLRFTPDQHVLSFDVIGSLAFQEDGSLDDNRAIALLRVFLPDHDDALPILAFVQSCDVVYKRLRYLRAALSNSSKIDSVLEDIFNVVFYSILAVILLSLLGFNPWPLLVSFSTLTVSFAFAFGPSVAKNIEGILMIAVRRPYDIGDRITISGAEAPSNVPLSNSWLVEDITLTTSTLRFAATNEVATINNSSVANSRIVNCARSPKAQVTINVKVLLDASQRQIDELRGKIELYLEESRVWVGLILYRADDINNEIGYVVMKYRAQHTKSWQELGAIMAHRGEWQHFANMTANEMGILFDIPPIQMLPVGVSSRNSKILQNRLKRFESVQSTSGNSEQHNTGITDDQIFGIMSQYSSPLPPQLDSATLEAFGTGTD